MNLRRRGFIETSESASDPQLRGRTYAVPFEDVWQAALQLTGGGLRGWARTSANDTDGLILVSTKGITGALHEISVRITLDENGQTRVDASAHVQKVLVNLGRSRRRLRRFFRALDRAVARAPQRSTARPAGRTPATRPTSSTRG